MATKIYRNGKGGYTVDHSEVFRFEMVYDERGVYLGQWQTNMLDDGPDFFFKADMINGRPHVDGKPVANLTEEEMRSVR